MGGGVMGRFGAHWAGEVVVDGWCAKHGRWLCCSGPVTVVTLTSAHVPSLPRYESSPATSPESTFAQGRHYSACREHCMDVDVGGCVRYMYIGIVTHAGCHFVYH
jgi:hypothetical protein